MASVNEFLGQHENRKQLFGKFATNDVAREFSRQDKTRQDKTRQDKTRQDKTRQDKTRQDIYYQNITCTNSLHAVSRKTLVISLEINSNIRIRQRNELGKEIIVIVRGVYEIG